MDFTFNDDQLAFREAISRFLMTEAAPEMLREIWETDVGRSRDLRNKIAEQGLTALSVPEAEGGLGMDDLTWALMTQELGYYAIPDSLADTAYVAAGLAAYHQAAARKLFPLQVVWIFGPLVVLEIARLWKQRRPKPAATAITPSGAARSG